MPPKNLNAEINVVKAETKVIITVDDFGPCSDVNERAFVASEAGLITRVSAIINISWPENTLEELKRRNIPVGLHLNISSGSALSPIEQIQSLVNSDGNFLPENRSSNLSHIRAEEISIEFSSQLQSFYSMGLTLSHLDNHRPEIYFFPHLLEYPLHLASDENVSLRHPLRNFSLEDISILAKKFRTSEEDISKLKILYDNVIAKKRVKCPDYFLSDTSFGGIENALEAISSKNIKGYCEIAVHLEGEMGKSNFEFMLSDRFRNWARNFEVVTPSEWRQESKKS